MENQRESRSLPISPIRFAGACVVVLFLVWLMAFQGWPSAHADNEELIYLDDIVLTDLGGGAPPTPTPTSSQSIAVSINATANRRPINPYIYGMNFAGEELAKELELPVNRRGGNSMSRYNYLTDISNHARDWYFENIKESNAENPPEDSALIRFIAGNRRTQTESLVTLPLSGYVANGVDRACGFSVEKYGPQLETDPWQSDCGSGVRGDGSFISGNDPLDTSIVAGPNFASGWVDYLVGLYGPASSGGVRIYNLDNEPDLWFDTHRDVQPIGWKYQEFRDRTIAFAASIKAADPSAELAGPVVMGWTYYWYGAYDGQREDWSTPDDRLANGNVPFAPWYLRELKAYEDTHGVRLLDYFDLHYYPQAPGVSLRPAGDSTLQALRLRSTRSLWDPDYVDESWIKDAGPDGGIVRLIPRMKAWVAQYYPGTRLAMTEYNWGALDHINGALAQAEVLGILGREGMDLATLWAPPQSNQPGAYAFRMFRNYDGKGAKFGDMSVRAVSADVSKLGAFAAQQQDGTLTLMLINKATQPITATIDLAGFAPAANGALHRYSSVNLDAIEHLGRITLTDSKLDVPCPIESITLVVIPRAEIAFRNWLYLPSAQR